MRGSSYEKRAAGGDFKMHMKVAFGDKFVNRLDYQG